MVEWSLNSDLDDIVDRYDWNALRQARVFLTGGTGFIGCWLLEALRRADERLGLELRVVILTRDPGRFADKAPHLAEYPSFELHQGNVTDFEFPLERFTHVIHGATDASAQLNETNPLLMLETIVSGTRRVLEFAAEMAADRVLMLSSGAVYGQQPWDVDRVSETTASGPDSTVARNAYAEGKRAAEMLCGIYAKQFGLKVSIARIFALLGPYLSLDAHFAAGNFIRDAMAGRSISVEGDGRTVRSYLYPTDVVVWLLRILTAGAPGKAYNVGSDEPVSIAALAECIARVLAAPGFEIRGRPDVGWNPGRYVPSTDLAARELGLYKTVVLEEAVRRTALWNGWKQQ